MGGEAVERAAERIAAAGRREAEQQHPAERQVVEVRAGPHREVGESHLLDRAFRERAVGAAASGSAARYRKKSDAEGVGALPSTISMSAKWSPSRSICSQVSASVLT